MSKKSSPNIFINLLYKLVQDFLDDGIFISLVRLIHYKDMTDLPVLYIPWYLYQMVN